MRRRTLRLRFSWTVKTLSRIAIAFLLCLYVHSLEAALVTSLQNAPKVDVPIDIQSEKLSGRLSTSLQQLKSSDSQDRLRAVAMLAALKYDDGSSYEPNAVIAALVDALGDQDPLVQNASAERLRAYKESLGPAELKTPSLLLRLKDRNPQVRAFTAWLFGSIRENLRSHFSESTARPNDRLIVPVLTENLGDQDATVRIETARALRFFDDQSIKQYAEPRIPDVTNALNDPNAYIKVTAAWILGAIGPQSSRAVPNLIAILSDKTPCVTISGAWALGSIGSGAGSAIPALATLSKAPPAADPGPGYGEHGADSTGDCYWAKRYSFGGFAVGSESAMSVLNWKPPPNASGFGMGMYALSTPQAQDFAADAIVRIADATVNDQKTDRIRSFYDAADTLGSLQTGYAQGASKRVRNDVAILQSIRRGQLGYNFISYIVRFPKLSAFILCYALLAILCVSLLAFSPFVLWRFNEWLAPLPHFKLPSALGGMDVSLPTLLLVGFLQYHPRVLDAWVSKFRGKVAQVFESSFITEQNKLYVETPVQLDRIALPHITPRELRGAFSRDRACILIWGEGGSGKTSLAYRIAAWGMSEYGSMRPTKHCMLPIVIEEDVSLISGNDRDKLIEVIRGKLKNTIGGSEAPRECFVRELLRKKRLLLLVDGLSELSLTTRDLFRPIDPQFDANALIITSRFEENLDGIMKATLHPMRIEGNRLSSFMEAYLSKRGKREEFSDAEFFEGCKSLSSMVGKRDMTVLLAKLFAEQMISAKDGDLGNALPQSIPDLMLEYLNRINRRHVGIDDRALHTAVKIIAWECLRKNLRPAPAKFSTISEALGEDRKAILRFLEDELQLIATLGAARDKIRFALDPLAEYLAALYLVEANRDDEPAWHSFLDYADSMPGAPQSIREFMLALRDCCFANEREMSIPMFVQRELATRVESGAKAGETSSTTPTAPATETR